MDGLERRGAEVFVLTSNFVKRGVVMTPEPRIYRRLKRHGVGVSAWLPIYKLAFQENFNQHVLKAALERIKPDVVYVWNMRGISKSLLFTLQAQQIPIVYSIHDHWIYNFTKTDVWLKWWNIGGASMLNTLGRMLFALTGIKALIARSIPLKHGSNLRCKHVAFNSLFMRELAIEEGANVEDSRIIPSGVDTESFVKKTEFKPIRRLLWVGRLNEDKEPQVAAQALKMMVDRGYNLSIDFYGGGEDEYFQYLSDLIDRMGVTDRVVFSRASHKGMRRVYSRYDALVFTSNWGEPFALVPIEAMSAKLPCVLSLDGGTRDMVRAGAPCISFKPTGAESLVNALEGLMQLDDHGEAMAEKAHQFVRENYEMETIVDQHENFLKDVTKRHQKSASKV